MSENYERHSGGYLHNCIIKRRSDEEAPCLFDTASHPGLITAHLIGYAIIPREEYDELKRLHFEESK
jgi:hypothetical protein